MVPISTTQRVSLHSKPVHSLSTYVSGSVLGTSDLLTHCEGSSAYVGYGFSCTH